MTEDNWKPINTAPYGVAVKVGGYYSSSDKPEWRQEIAKRGWFGWGLYKTHYHTHWAELPPPPHKPLEAEK